MKIHAQEILKRNIQFVLFIGLAVLCFISISMSLVSMMRSKKPIIIGIDNNGTRIVTEQNDPIYKTEAVQFIRKFFFHAYNFDSGNFFKRLGFATTLMSEELWKKKQGEIVDLKNKIERDQIELQSQILKINQDESGLYHALVQIKEKTRLNIKDHEVEVAIKLKPVPRTQDNPYGMEVDSYEETLIRN